MRRVDVRSRRKVDDEANEKSNEGEPRTKGEDDGANVERRPRSVRINVGRRRRAVEERLMLHGARYRTRGGQVKLLIV